MSTVIAAAAPVSIVLYMASATIGPSFSPEIDNCEPPLNAKKPNIRIKPPSAANCMKRN